MNVSAGAALLIEETGEVYDETDRCSTSGREAPPTIAISKKSKLKAPIDY